MLLLAAVRFPFLIYAQTNLVFALLFCQPVSFLDVDYYAVSFLILSRLVTLNNLLNHVISALMIRLSSSFFKYQNYSLQIKGCVWKPISELRSADCRTGSHSVTCHPTQVNVPRLNPSQAGPGRYLIYLTGGMGG